MYLRILFFGVLRDSFGGSPLPLELPPDSTVADVLSHYRARFPQPTSGLVLDSVAVAVNSEYATADHLLVDGDEVALLPPVSGGRSTSVENADPDPVQSILKPGQRIALISTPIPVQYIVESLKQGPDGAVVLFDGIVRDNTRGRQTLYLDYEAYPAMAMKQMHHLAAQAVERYPVRDVALVHRLGRLAIGESSVVIAVTSAHRAAAFDACRFLIDQLKQSVPIWKKEYFIDGAVWAAGEPFPAEIRPNAKPAQTHISSPVSVEDPSQPS